MTGVIIDVAVLALVLVRQVQARPLNGGLVLIVVLGVLGLGGAGAFLFGQQQFTAAIKGHSHHLALAVPGGGALIAAAAGSLVLAGVTGALRAPSQRLWRQDGQVWRKGTALTIVLWLVSLGLHFGFDALAFHGAEAARFSAATIDLYFAVSLAAQRAVLHARARRLPDAGPGMARHPVSSRAGW